MDISALFFGYSKALYSTWVYYKPDHLLIDCGEGAATSLGNGSFAIERVLLTHGHIDHISGLPSLLWSRAAGMGDKLKPLTIYYPKGDLFVEDMKTYLQRTRERLPFDLQWVALDAGATIPLGGRRQIETFATEHVPGRLTLGYKVVETRRKLKAEYSTLSQDELRQRAVASGKAGMVELMTEYSAPLVAWSGDGIALKTEPIAGCELLFHEATLLDAAERKHQLHATLDEAMEVAARAQVKALVLYHISGRYCKSEIEKRVRAFMRRNGISFPVWCLFRDRLWPITSDDTERDGVKKRNTPRRRKIRVWTSANVSGDDTVL